MSDEDEFGRYGPRAGDISTFLPLVGDQIPEGWVEVRWMRRLWSAIPKAARATRKDIDAEDPGDDDEFFRPLRDALRRTDGCQSSQYIFAPNGSRFARCGRPVFEDAQLCPLHNGPPAPGVVMVWSEEHMAPIERS